jgi:hypothetical protein
LVKPLGKLDEESVKEALRLLRPELPPVVRVHQHGDQKLPMEVSSRLFIDTVLRAWRKDLHLIVIEDLLYDAKSVHEYLIFGKHEGALKTIWPDILNVKPQEYVYWKVFLPAHLAECFIQELGSLAEDLPFFWIYYNEPHFQIRLRIRRKNNLESSTLFLEELLERGLIQSYQRCIYQPELVRWQGAEGLLLQERISEWDSKMRKLRIISGQTSSEEIHGVLLFWIRQFFRKDHEAAMSFLKETLKLCSPFPLVALKGKLQGHSMINSDEHLDSLLEECRPFLQRSPDPSQWIRDIIHMSLNRTSPSISRGDERYAYKCALATFKRGII